ncbi:hypothetical protein KCP69_20690 [Salmonella enterica subsp. enterica]|nr:hypothetical protein KCP69_20690 [Salmonella enterica subsp. enterica]
MLGCASGTYPEQTSFLGSTLLAVTRTVSPIAVIRCHGETVQLSPSEGREPATRRRTGRHDSAAGKL